MGGEDRLVLDGRLRAIRVVRDPERDGIALSVDLDQAARASIARFTGKHVGERVEILVAGRTVATLLVRDPVECRRCCSPRPATPRCDGCSTISRIGEAPATTLAMTLPGAPAPLAALAALNEAIENGSTDGNRTIIGAISVVVIIAIVVGIGQLMTGSARSAK